MDQETLEIISADTRISIADIKEAMGIPMAECTATTLEEAQDMYCHAPEGSEAEKKALEKWISFVKAFAEAEDVFNKTWAESGEEEKAMEKWISLATTLGEAEMVWRYKPNGIETRKASIRKIVELWFKEHDTASTE